MTKCIGILTSGGDCAGLNATIRAVALRAHHGYGWKTIGISHGTHGLLHRPVAAEPLDPARLDAVLARQGGTFLGTTNRGNPFAFPMPDGTHEGPLGRDGRGPARAASRRADRRRRRRQPRDPAPAAGGDQPAVHRRPQDDRQRRRPAPSARSAIRRRSPSPPRRSTACSRPAPATTGSWCWR